MDRVAASEAADPGSNPGRIARKKGAKIRSLFSITKTVEFICKILYNILAAFTGDPYNARIEVLDRVGICAVIGIKCSIS